MSWREVATPINQSWREQAKPVVAEQTEFVDPRAGFREEIQETFTPQEPNWRNLSFTERMAALQDLEAESPESGKYEALFGAQAAPGLAKGVLSGLTLGLSEKDPRAVFGLAGLGVPNMEPLTEKPEDIGFKAGEIAGSVLPLEGLYSLFGKPLVNLAARSPILPKALSSVARLTGWGLTGATEAGIKEAIKEDKVNPEAMLEHGAIFAAIEAALGVTGKLAQFGKGLYNLARKTQKPSAEYLTKIAEQVKGLSAKNQNAEQISEIALKALENQAKESGKVVNISKKPIDKVQEAAIQRLPTIQETKTNLLQKKVEPEVFNKLNQKVAAIEQAAPSLPEDVSPSALARSLEEDALETPIRQFHSQSYRDEEIGNLVREGIETQRAAERSEYAPLYSRAREESENVFAPRRKSAKVAGETLISLEKLKTKPAGYTQVISSLKNTLEDLGFIIETDAAGNVARITTTTKGIEVPKLMELGRRLNEIIDFDVLEPVIKDRLKPLAKAVKADIREGLSQAGAQDALAAFNQAERQHGILAGKLNRDTIRRIRQIEEGEKISGDLLKPTVLKDLKEILDPEQMRAVERKVLDHLRDMSYDRARKTFQELFPHLSKDAQNLGRQILENAQPLGRPFQQKAVAEGALNNLAEAIVTGEKPAKLLKLWKTPQGRKLVKEVLKNNPNKEQIFDYLSNQTFYDWSSDLFNKEGSFDLSKLQKALKEKQIIENIEDMGGNQAVRFFKNLDSDIKQLQRNMFLVRLPAKDTELRAVPASERGKFLLQKAGIKAQSKSKANDLFNKIFSPQSAPPKIRESLKRLAEATTAAPGEWGSKKLAELAKKDYKLWATLQALQEALGLSNKQLLSIAGLFAFQLPKAAAGYAGFNVFKKMATNPNVRAAFKDLAKPRKDFSRWVAAWGALAEELAAT